MKAPKAKEGELLVKFGKSAGEIDLFYCFPANGSGMKRDSRLLSMTFEYVEIFEGKTLRELLEERGYDIRTFKFSILKKASEK